ncbi:hypothetical protein [Shewanella frigidimarina]|uniref:hypothetical protein n=1 Tax=Shewanella frigidimarina TaxID=56812 RepID=UPI003D78EDD7
MCSTPKTNLAAATPKVPFRSFMASMTLAQRQQFAEVANRADERRKIREDRLKGQSNNKNAASTSNTTGNQNMPLMKKLLQFCKQHIVI